MNLSGETLTTGSTIDANLQNLGVDLTPTLLTILMDAMRVNKSVTNINCKDCNIRARGARSIADMLAVNSSIKTLNLSGNLIGTSGARAMAQILSSTSVLTSLDLSFARIGTRLIFQPSHGLTIPFQVPMVYLRLHTRYARTQNLKFYFYVTTEQETVEWSL